MIIEYRTGLISVRVDQIPGNDFNGHVCIHCVCLCFRRYIDLIHFCCSVFVVNYFVLIVFLSGLLRVTNIASVSGNLTLNPPQNVPRGCIANYTITWDDGNFTTPDNRTSIPFDDIPGLKVCRTYTSIVVTPIVPPFGPIQSSSGVLIPSGTEIIYTITHAHAKLLQQVYRLLNWFGLCFIFVSDMLSECSYVSDTLAIKLNVLVHGCSLYSLSLE